MSAPARVAAGAASRTAAGHECRAPSGHIQRVQGRASHTLALSPGDGRSAERPAEWQPSSRLGSPATFPRAAGRRSRAARSPGRRHGPAARDRCRARPLPPARRCASRGEAWPAPQAQLLTVQRYWQATWKRAPARAVKSVRRMTTASKSRRSGAGASAAPRSLGNAVPCARAVSSHKRRSLAGHARRFTTSGFPKTTFDQLWSATQLSGLRSTELALAHINDSTRNRDGCSALNIIACPGEIEVTERLLAAGADPDRNSYMRTLSSFPR